MNRLMLWIVACVVLPAGTAFAQDVTGTWQGTLSAGRELRIVIQISKEADSSALRAVLYSIDQGAQGLPGNVSVDGATIKMSIPGIGGTFEGRLDAGGRAISGMFSQGGKPLPLNLRRATPDTAWPIPEAPEPLKPMAADANPSFEVATIKPSAPDRPGRAFQVRGRQFSTINTTLSDLMTFAYGIHARQIVGAPSWSETDKYDLTARPDGEGQPSQQQWKVMLQKLLAERFNLTFHRDKRELAAYAIQAEKSGHKLTKSEGDPNGLPALFFRGLGNLPARNATVSDLAGVLQSAVLDRPVVDQTGIAGRYDFTLTWTPDEFQFAGVGGGTRPSGDATAPDLFTAVRQQLGLRLESTRVPAEVLVIDRVEKPTDN